MYRKKTRGWAKHLDFIVLDLICLEIAFFLAYLLRSGRGVFRENEIYSSMYFVLPVIGLLVIIFGNGFKNVLKRGILDELGATLKQVVLVCVLGIVYLFAQHASNDFSRLAMLYTGIFYAVFSFAARLLWKRHLHRKMSNGGRVSLLLVTTPDRLRQVKYNVIDHNYAMYSFDGIALLNSREGRSSDKASEKKPGERPDAAPAVWTYGLEEDPEGNEAEEALPERNLSVGDEYAGLRVVADEATLIDYLMGRPVDEVLFDVEHEKEDPDAVKLINTVLSMGITTHVRLEGIGNVNAGYQSVGKLGTYLVYTAAIREAGTGQLVLKRLLDIVGGLVGCAITGVLTVIFGPVIYRKSPGASIFFHQTRIGQNGRKFEMYKFRSMYPDAEERKKELMKENRVKDAMMFKLDYDPRIIGCYKDENGEIHKGIGNFIREKSIDEFPQFWNVLKGDMSLVGTRPPTLDEWEKYEPYMRSRMSCKPGITGLWQVSGRSEITDFDEVVKLDLEYIEHWTFGMDIKILVKTVKVVLKGEGAM